MATNTAGGPTLNNVPDQLTVSLTVAKGGMAYGPITETWTVAQGSLIDLDDAHARPLQVEDLLAEGQGELRAGHGTRLVVAHE